MSNLNINISGKDLDTEFNEIRQFITNLLGNAEYDQLEIRVTEGGLPQGYRPGYPMFRSGPVENLPPIHSFASTWLLKTREDAMAVIEAMGEILDRFEVVSLSDFKELVGAPATHVDHRWVWDSLKDVEIKHAGDGKGWTLNLPSPMPFKVTDNN